MQNHPVTYIPATWCPDCYEKSRATIHGYYRSAMFPNPSYTNASEWFKQFNTRNNSSSKNKTTK